MNEQHNISVKQIFSLFTGVLLFGFFAIWALLISGIFASTSVDATTTFSTPTTVKAVNDRTDSEIIYRDSQYQLFFTSTTASVYNLYFTTSSNGATWNSPQLIHAGVSPTSSLSVKYNATSSITSISFFDANRYVVFASSSNGYSFSTSTVSTESGARNRFDHVVNESGNFAATLLWQRRDNNATNELQIITSTLGGAWGSTSSIVYIPNTNLSLTLLGAEIDRNNIIHLMYYYIDDSDNNPLGDIIYASSSDYGSTWTSTTIDSGLGFDIGMGTASYAELGAMTLDANGNPAATYYKIDAVDGGTFMLTSSLRYAKRSSAGAWSTSTVDSNMAVTFSMGNTFQYSPDIKIYGSNYAYISYVRADGSRHPSIADNLSGSFVTSTISVTTTHYYEPGSMSLFLAPSYVATAFVNSNDDLKAALASLDVPVAPTAPSGIRTISTGISTSQTGITWTDNSGLESGYVVEYSTNGSSWTQFSTTSANASSATVTGLTPETGYYYRVAAFNSYGTSSYSSLSTPVYTFGTSTAVYAPSTTLHELVYVNGQFFLVYSASETSTVNNIYSVTSSDGVTWSEPEMILSNVVVGGDTANTFDLAVNNMPGKSSTQEWMSVIAQKPSKQFYTVYYAPSYGWVTVPVVQTLASTSSIGRLHYAYATSSYYYKAYGYNVNNTGYEFKSRRVPATHTSGAIDDIISGQTNKLLGLAITGVTSSEVLHVAYFQEDTSDGNPSGIIKYASSSDNGSTWTSTTVATGLSASFGGTYSSFNSMATFAMSASGTMGLVFQDISSVAQVSGSVYDVTSTFYVYTKEPGAAWTSVGSQSQSGQENIETFSYHTPDIIFSEDGYPIVVYYNLTTKYPTLGYKRSSFDITTITTTQITGRNNLSVAYDENDQLLVSSFVQGTNINIVTTSINFVDAGLASPGTVTASSRSTSSLTIAWGDTSDGELGFRVATSLDNSTFTNVATTSPNATSASITGLDTGRIYYVRVTAYGSQNTYSTYLTGGTYTLPVTSTLTVGTVSSTSIGLTINSSTNHSSVLYAIYNTTSEGYIYTNGAATSSESFAAKTSYGSLAATGLTANTSYSFAITSKNANGDRTATSSLVSTTTLASVPTVSATAGADYANVSWSGDASSYQLYNVTAGTTGDWTTSTSATVSSLTCGTTYEFKVRGKNSAEVATSYSSTASVTTSDCPSSSSGSGFSPNSSSNAKPLIIPGKNPVLINGGAPRTSNLDVTLTLSMEDVIQVGISQDPTFKNIPLETFTSTKPFTLQNKDGVQYVYVRFRNQSGETIDFSASIIVEREKKEFPKEIIESCPLTIGTPYKTAKSNAVFIIMENCTKKPVPNEYMYFTYFDSWSAVRTASQVDLDSIPTDESLLKAGALFTPRNGSIFKRLHDPKTYYLIGTTLHHIQTEAVFNGLGFKWQWIIPVEDAVFDGFVQGEPLSTFDSHPDYSIIKYPNSTRVYLLESGKRRWIKTVQAFNKLKLEWGKIIEIKTSEEYPLGAEIN